MDSLLDIFSDDAFSLVSMIQAINNIDHIPGRAGELCFAGVGTGVPTTSVAIESRDFTLSVIPTSPRGGPAPQEKREKAELFKLAIPQIKLEETIGAHAIQDIRAFGVNQLAGAQDIVSQQMTKIGWRLDLTLEHHRLGALKGRILDADGSILTDLYSAFGVAEPSPIEFSASASTLRKTCQETVRHLLKTVKMILPNTAQVYALCGDTFFDTVMEHTDVKTVYANWQGAQQALGGNFVRKPFEFGGIVFENYIGTDNTTEAASSDTLIGEVGIASDECRIFLTGIPGLYTESFAPADFLQYVNSLGLPRYAMISIDPEMQRWVKLHAQMNPLPLCARPQTLLRGVFA